MEFIENNIDKPWDWGAISATLFTKDKEQFMLQKYKEHIAAFRIQ